MWQVWSKILGCTCGCGESEDESDQNPRESSSYFLSSPSIPPFKTITRTEFLQTNSSEYSCIDPSITTPVSNPPPDHLSDLVCGDSTSNTVALDQNLLISPPQSSVLGYSQRDSTTAHTIQQDTTLFSSLVSKTITRTEFLQTNSSEYSCIDPSIITTPVSIPPPPPPPDLSDLVFGDSTSNTVALHQNLLISPPQSSVLGYSQTNSSEYSCIDPSIITTPISNPPPPPPPHLSDLVFGDFTSNTVALHQNLLTSPPQSSVLDYLSTTKDTGTLFSSLVSEESIIISDEKSNLKEPPPGEKEEAIEEEEKVVINKAVLVIEERWIKHYSSFQKILLVGEGDFSFSASLAMAFGSAHNIVATSLNTTGYLSRNYRSAMPNIRSLRNRGAKVMHGVDTTQMAGQILFQGMTFDRIVFNFPLSGFFADDSRGSKLRRERKLVRLFIVNAREMIAEGGEIHVTHKSNGFFREWNLEQLALSAGLQLIDEVHFNFTDFPGYRTKYGFGGDKNFNCNPSNSYKFGL